MTTDLHSFCEELRPLQRISPSRFLHLQQCALREVWQADGKTPLIPISPSARLGSIAHHVLELAGRGRLRGTQELDGAWDDAVSRIQEEMRRTGEKHLLPLRKHAFRYEVKKRLTFAAAERIIDSRPDESAPTGTPVAVAGSEIWLESKDGHVGGFIDRIIPHEDGVEILDYKTGPVTDERTGNVKSAYEVQLLLYAALYNEVYGEWPAKLTLRSLDSAPREVQLDPASALSLMEEARTRLSEVNTLIATHPVADELANPSPATCEYCCYRPACKQYWRSRIETPEWPVDITGNVTEVSMLGNGMLRALVETDGGTVAIRGLSPARFGFLMKGAGGVMLCNLRREPAKGSYAQRSITVGYPWNDEIVGR